jgi:hypothetical protein
MNSDKLDWFYNLPTKKGSYWLVAPRAFEGEFFIKITFTTIKENNCYLVEPRGKDWLLGLLFFFRCFTETFETGEFGNSGGEDPLPFYICFPTDIKYFVFRDAAKGMDLNIKYIPVISLFDSKFLKAYYFL